MRKKVSTSKLLIFFLYPLPVLLRRIVRDLAEREALILRQSTSDNSNPTKRSNIRLACWALTRSKSSLRGLETAL
jgi:hypothetical protein